MGGTETRDAFSARDQDVYVAGSVETPKQWSTGHRCSLFLRIELEKRERKGERKGEKRNKPSSSFFPDAGIMSAVQYCFVDNGHAIKPLIDF